MWRIEHKCTILQPEPSEYAMTAAEHNGQPVTHLICPNCREFMLLIGHDMFKEAQPVAPGHGLPPGFVIAQARKQ